MEGPGIIAMPSTAAERAADQISYGRTSWAMMAAFFSESLSDTNCSASPSWSLYFISKQAGFSPLVFACKQERFDKTLCRAIHNSAFAALTGQLQVSVSGKRSGDCQYEVR